MGILKTTTNLVASAKYKFNRFFSANLKDAPSTGGTALAQALWYPPDLKRCANISNNTLMLAVEHVRSCGTRDYSFISTEGGSFKAVQHNPPNFSMLRAEEYCHMFNRGNYCILSSYNKWMLLKCIEVIDLAGVPHELLWNPTTNEMRPLPFFAWSPLFHDINFEVEWNCHSIGFDPASDDYKVVRYGLLEGHCCGQVRVEAKAHTALFSLKTGSWKRIPYPHCPYTRPIPRTCVHINGISYWIAAPVSEPARLRTAIVSFDFTNENFPELIPIPDSDRLVHPRCLDIAEVHGSLAAIVSKYLRDDEPVVKEPFEFEIWVWNDGWSFDSTYTVPLLDDDVCVEAVLGLYRNDKVVLLRSNYSLLLYDCHNRVLKDLGLRDEVDYVTNIYPYVQSI